MTANPIATTLPTSTEEDYLKAIYKLARPSSPASTNAIAAHLSTTPASVTDMLKRLGEKGWVKYMPYKGAQLTELGKRLALRTIRKHRLWEVFLVEKLKFTWDEVHDTAEQLEHVMSPRLVEALDAFLGYPKFDPHGDPIPDADGVMQERTTVALSQVQPGTSVVLAGVLSDEPSFLQYLDRLGLSINTELIMLEHLPFDDSRLVQLAGKEVLLTSSVAHNLLVVLT